MRSYMALAIILGLAGPVACSREPAPVAVDPEAVERCFAEYKDALERGDGRALAAMVSRRTLELFSSLRDLALYADRETVAALPVFRKIQVLAMRAAFDPGVLADLGERELFAELVARGWIDTATLHEVDLTEIEGDQGRAIARVVEGGEATDQGVAFAFEDGRWKLDLIQSLGDSDRYEKTQMIGSGLAENDYVLDRVRAYTGASVPLTIWDPPREPPAG